MIDLEKMNKNGEPTLAIAVNVEKKVAITTIFRNAGAIDTTTRLL